MIFIPLLIGLVVALLCASNMSKKLKLSEKVIYIAWCIGTLGAFWAIKILIKIAIIEAKEKENVL